MRNHLFFCKSIEILKYKFQEIFIKGLEIKKKCDIIICKLKIKNKSKDNTNYKITFREPKAAENLVSKNNLLSPNCFQTENFYKNWKKSKLERKSALKMIKRVIKENINY